MIEAGILEDGAPIELIEGDLIEMPSEGALQWSVKQKIVSWILRRLPSGIDLAPDGPLRLSDRNEPEPDIFLFPSGMDVNKVRGPDAVLVIEIADTSLEKDRLLKAPVYAAHHVREYWIVSLEARVTEVYRPENGVLGAAERVAFDGELQVPGVEEGLRLSDFLRVSD
jgi:Uma2 family endonuclease